MEGRRDDGGAPRAGPRAHAGGHPAQDQRTGLHGIPEGEELSPHVRQACQPEIQVREQEVLGGGCCVSAVGLSEATIAKYIREQEQAGIA